MTGRRGTEQATRAIPAPAPGSPAGEPDRDRGRYRPAAGLLLLAAVLGTLGERVLTFWHPVLPDSGKLPTATLVAGRDTWWAMHFFGGAAVALQAVALAAAVLLLVRDRGSVWGAAGSAMLGIGGILFGVGLAAEGASMAYAAGGGIAGGMVLEMIQDDPSRYLAGIGSGGVLMAAGTIAAVVALWRARSAPRWLLGLWILGLVVGGLFPFGILPALATTATVTTTQLLLTGLAASRLVGGRGPALPAPAQPRPVRRAAASAP